MKWIFVGLAAVLSFLIRSLDIGLSSYSIDEMVSLSQALSPHPWAWSWDNVPGLYIWILKPWVSAFGTSEIATRMLSASFSAMATGVLTAVALRVNEKNSGVVVAGHPWRAAVLVGFVHIFNPLSFELARETRAYALFELMVSIQLGLFLGFLGYGVRRGWLYLGVSAVTIAVHWLGFLPFLLQQGWVARTSRSDGIRLKALRLVGLGAVLLAIGLSTHVRWDFLRWQLLKFNVEPMSRWPLQVSNELLAGTGISVLAAALFIPLSLWRRPSSEASVEKKLLNGLGWIVLLTLFGATSAGWLMERAILVPRYYVFLVPVVALLVGLSIQSALERRGGIRWSAVGFLVVLCLSIFLSGPARYEQKSAPWRDLARLVSSYPQSAVVTTKTSAIQYPYFSDQKVPVRRWNGEVFQFEQLERDRAAYATVWVLESAWSGAQIFPALLEWLQQRRVGYDLIKSTDYGTERIVALKIQGKNRPIPYRARSNDVAPKDSVGD